MSNPNSTGRITQLNVTGMILSNLNRVALTAYDMSPSSTGFFIASRTAGPGVMPPGSAGILCLAGQIGRYVGPGQIGFSGATRRIRLVLNLSQTPSPNGLVSVLPGQTWHFQAWHRDVLVDNTNSNFSNAVAVTFQ